MTNCSDNADSVHVCSPLYQFVTPLILSPITDIKNFGSTSCLFILFGCEINLYNHSVPVSLIIFIALFTVPDKISIVPPTPIDRETFKSYKF